MAMVAVLFLVLTGCKSTKKNTASTRFYQSFTTRYNVYFNGEQHYLEQIKKMEDDYEDDLDLDEEDADEDEDAGVRDER